MDGGKGQFLPASLLRDPRFAARGASVALHVLVFLFCLAASWFVWRRMGLEMFMLAVSGVFLALAYAVVSFRSLFFPFVVWVLSTGGFRYLFSIQTPLLPDLFLDRMMLVWLGLVFFVWVFATRQKLRPPYLLDILVFSHGLYILIRVFIDDMEFANPWTRSILMPYAAYFFAKNIVTDGARVRKLLWVLLALLVYYEVTAVAEKLELHALIYPKLIITEATQFRGRSVGPFLQAPLFGTIIGILLPLHLYFVATVRNSLGRALILASFGLGIAGLYFTYTRGSWLAGVAALGVAAVLNRRHYLKVLVPALVVAPILAIGFLGAGQDQFLKERVENENTLGSRVATAITALKVWRDNPILGVGFFQYRVAREAYIEPISFPGLGTIRFIQFRHNNIHDIYLGPLAEDGLLGMSMQVGIYVIIFRTFRRKYRWRNRGDPFATYVLPIFAGVFVGYLVGGLAIDYRFFSFVGTLFYMSAGIQEGYQAPENTHVS
ncbi:O-antigen ligase family protein [bacterium]|nr:O-antigen ligase family protein [bacterium]